MLHCSLPLSTVTHDPLLFSHPRGKVVGSGKKANECFLKVPPSLISPALLSIPSTVPPQTSLFLFFSHSALQYMLRKSIAGLLRSNQKGKWEPAEARDWNKNLDKKNKDIFTRMTHLRNNAARSQTITDEKQMSWKKFQRKDWKIKTSALKTKRCGHCVMIQVSPSFFHFSDLQCFLNYLWAPAEAYRLFPHCPGC